MFYSDNNKILPSISKKNEEMILNVFIVLITNLITIILYFILIGCYNEDGTNICLIDNYEGWFKYNITLPINKFTEPLQSSSIGHIISNLINYRYPYLWMILGLVTAYYIINNRPNIIDNESNNSENINNLKFELGDPCNNTNQCNSNDYCHTSKSNNTGSCRRIFKHKL